MKTLEEYLLEFTTTLQYHDVLNPKLWVKDKLKSEVRKRLIEIGKFWANFAMIPSKAIEDIIFTGGNANYNYTVVSDLDIHILVDKVKIANCDVKILDDYLKDKKALWTLTHNIKVYDFPVELYAQDLKEKTSPNQGVYSLIKDKWIRRPIKEKVNFDDPVLAKKVKNYMDKIDSLINNKTDNFEMLDSMKVRIRDMRSAGVQKGGEFSIENLVFKELRNKGYLDKLSKYILDIEDKTFSLKSKDKKK